MLTWRGRSSTGRGYRRYCSLRLGSGDKIPETVVEINEQRVIDLVYFVYFVSFPVVRIISWRNGEDESGGGSSSVRALGHNSTMRSVRTSLSQSGKAQSARVVLPRTLDWGPLGFVENPWGVQWPMT